MTHRFTSRHTFTFAGLGIAALVGTMALAPTQGAAEGVENPAGEAHSRAFDDVPGLGRSEKATLRDEVISYWEAWKRDDYTAQCMSDAGFTWHPEAAYPEGPIVEIAESMGIEKSGRDSGVADPWLENQAVQESLPAAERERYFQTLFGESAATYDYIMENDGMLPPGHSGEFGAGGCKAAAEAAVGSIWDLGRDLAPEMDELRVAARETAAFKKAQVRYEQCAAENGLPAVSHPRDLERIASAGTDPAAVTAVDANCRSYWHAAGERGMQEVEQGFRQRHVTAFERQQNKYNGALNRAINDQAFRDFVGRAVDRL